MPSPPLESHQQIVSGDDCKAVDGRALTWTSGPVQPWPNLAGATLSMVIGHNQPGIYGSLPQTWTETLPGSPASPTTVSLDVTATQTALLLGGIYDYMLSATLVNGDVVTLAYGKLTVFPRPGTLTTI